MKQRRVIARERAFPGLQHRNTWGVRPHRNALPGLKSETWGTRRIRALPKAFEG
jgi:hypothetical protein